MQYIAPVAAAVRRWLAGFSELVRLVQSDNRSLLVFSIDHKLKMSVCLILCLYVVVYGVLEGSSDIKWFNSLVL